MERRNRRWSCRWIVVFPQTRVEMVVNEQIVLVPWPLLPHQRSVHNSRVQSEDASRSQIVFQLRLNRVR